MRIAAILTILVAALLAPGLAASEDPPVTAPNVAALQGVNFVGACKFSHRSMNDPIVYPRQPGAAHDHTFVGNRTTNAYSTLRSLRKGATTCKRPAETAAYWMPTLFLDGRAVLPRGATVYYRRATLKPVRPFPAGFKAISGDQHAMEAQPLRVTFWNCGVASGIPRSSTVPTCPDTAANSLRLHVNFGSCWTGTGLDSPDHRSHLAFPVRGVCPATHPVAVPAVSIIYRYAITGGPGVTLSSGGQLTGHADFFNAWDQPALRTLVVNCLNQLRHCGQGD